jgi:hypothetical protein
MTEDDWRWHMYDTVRPIWRQTRLPAYMHLLAFTGQRVRLARRSGRNSLYDPRGPEDSH